MFEKHGFFHARTLKEHGGEYGSLEKSEQKLLNKELNKLATALVKKVYMSQAYMLDE